MSGAGAYKLERFVDAQKNVYEQVRSELQAGSKESHWMWFIFPQLKGLGHSQMANFYGIASRAEAEAYLAHPVLGPRLSECTALVNAIPKRSINAILGYPDDLKFHSSMTLFSLVFSGDSEFRRALDKYFDGEADQLTVTLLR